ncbi:MAG: beta-lactamase family protein [Planctomycetaceae bacterium]|nr:beta-lactamase family protein [Planctomycetaceae bacterium]
MSLNRDGFRRLCSCLLIWTLLPLSGAAIPPASGNSVISGVDQAMTDCIEAGEIAGAVTLVTGPDGVLHESAVGYADVEEKIPMRTDHLFWIASMTKPITGVAVCMLHEEGQLNVEDSVTKYLPEFKRLRDSGGNPVEITITNLLTHTSGLSDLKRDRENEVKSLQELVELTVELPVNFEPGSKWSYCQTGINTAARIVEVVSGMPFEEFLKQRLFAPLGMTDTTFYLTDEQVPRLATSYRKTEAGLEPTEVFILGGKSPTSRERYPRANGGLFSTAHDYGQFCRMLLNQGELNGRRILKPETVTLFAKIHSGDVVTGFTAGNGWGLGCCVVRKPQGVTEKLSPGTFGHGGAYGTQAWIDPNRKQALVLMVQRANFPNADASDVRRAFQDAVLSQDE